MRLGDFKQAGRGRFVAAIADVAGDDAYELTIDGPTKLVRTMFAKAEIDLQIDASGAKGRWAKECDEIQAKQSGVAVGASPTDRFDELLKPSFPDPDKGATVFVAVRPTRGGHTPFFFTLTSFFVPTGANLFFIGRPVRVSVATVTPKSGDQDLLMWAFPPGFPVSSSAMGGLSTDIVSFFIPPFFPPEFQFVPIFRLRGFAAGVCGVFTAIGI